MEKKKVAGGRLAYQQSSIRYYIIYIYMRKYYLYKIVTFISTYFTNNETFIWVDLQKLFLLIVAVRLPLFLLQLLFPH